MIVSIHKCPDHHRFCGKITLLTADSGTVDWELLNGVRARWGLKTDWEPLPHDDLVPVMYDLQVGPKPSRRSARAAFERREEEAARAFANLG